jgi:hypothetical protein
MINAYILDGKPERKRPNRIPRPTWKIKVKGKGEVDPVLN